MCKAWERIGRRVTGRDGRGAEGRGGSKNTLGLGAN